MSNLNRARAVSYSCYLYSGISVALLFLSIFRADMLFLQLSALTFVIMMMGMVTAEYYLRLDDDQSANIIISIAAFILVAPLFLVSGVILTIIQVIENAFAWKGGD